jgi:hypothetical protein
MKKFIYISLFVLICVSVINSQTTFEEMNLKGTIGNSPIVMKLFMPSGPNYNSDSGHYYYTKIKKKINLEGESTFDLAEGAKPKIYESVGGKKTGYFMFDATDNLLFLHEGSALTGSWFSMDGKKKLPVTLQISD